jgi:hypothetical protein
MRHRRPLTHVIACPAGCALGSRRPACDRFGTHMMRSCRRLSWKSMTTIRTATVSRTAGVRKKQRRSHMYEFCAGLSNGGHSVRRSQWFQRTVDAPMMTRVAITATPMPIPVRGHERSVMGRRTTGRRTAVELRFRVSLEEELAAEEEEDGAGKVVRSDKSGEGHGAICETAQGDRSFLWPH